LLRAKPEQLKKLQAIAKELATPDRDRAKPHISEEYRAVLDRLHGAFAADNEKQVEELEDRLSELTESEEPELDDGVAITPSARKHVAEVLRTLRPRQVAEYVGAISEDIGDPQERLIAAFEQIRSDKTENWEEVRDEQADDLAWLLGGLDSARFKAIHDEVANLLTDVHKLDSDTFTKQRSDLEKKARGIGSDVAATDVLRHAMERALAQLLSNPELGPAVEARLKSAK
jgi:hypothetical protein